MLFGVRSGAEKQNKRNLVTDVTQPLKVDFDKMMLSTRTFILQQRLLTALGRLNRLKDRYFILQQVVHVAEPRFGDVYQPLLLKKRMFNIVRILGEPYIFFHL